LPRERAAMLRSPRMAWFQKTISLAPRPRGFHLITDELERAVPELAQIRVGIAHFFIQHTSASLCINENADPTVRTDLESSFNVLAPERAPHYRHTTEGPDDMPAHIKAALIGSSLAIPVTDGRLNLGTWQGICLCEHRDRGGARRIVVTIEGEP
jgi:secondary thiamine-phosphate synthase enzyme